MSQPENTIEGGGDFPKDFTCCHSLSYLVSLTMICFVRYYKIKNHERIFSCEQNINKLNDARYYSSFFEVLYIYCINSLYLSNS